MAKKSTAPKIPNRHVHSRISFLQQAANLLALQGDGQECKKGRLRESSKADDAAVDRVSSYGIKMSQRLMTDLKAVSQKTLVRMSRDMKRSVCKRCDTLLVPGLTSSSQVENKSRGGRKSKADILVIRCQKCHTEKRMPCGLPPQPKKRDRKAADESEDAQEAKTGVDQAMVIS